MVNTINIKITEFASRKNTKGKVNEITWEGLTQKLSDPHLTDELIAEYEAMTNEQRTAVKDVGGFIGGECKDGIRSKDTVLNRYLLTIDADNALPNAIEEYERKYNYVFFCHSTHSYTKEQPRLRWVFPLARPVNADEYRIIAHVAKNWVGEQSVDESTDQPERLMFWPSISLDNDFIAEGGGTIVVDPDELLKDYDLQETSEAKKRTPLVDSSEVIPEGNRHDSLMDFASKLRRYGIGGETLLQMVMAFNNTYCSPPSPEEEVQQIVEWINKKKPGDILPGYLRRPENDFADLGEIVDHTKPDHQQKLLDLESFADLCARIIPKPKFLVENLITQGLTLLASPPKYRKSWMALDMCISVAGGTPFLGMKTTQTGVIYLALEDGDYRLKDRGLKVNGGRPLPSNLLLSKEAPPLENELIPILERTIQTTTTQIGLIVIDTLQKIRGGPRKNEGVYAFDYRELGELQHFAQKNGLSIVLVHHLNKGKNDGKDNVARINGSTGIAGAVDTIITLTKARRFEEVTRMEVTGREVPQKSFDLIFDDSTFRWTCLGETGENIVNNDKINFLAKPLVKTIIKCLDEVEDIASDKAETITWRVSAKELRNLIKHHTGTEAESGPNIGRKIAADRDKLWEYANIKYLPCYIKKERGYEFSRPIDPHSK